MLIGILRETKTPSDRRVPLTPLQCREIMDTWPEIKILYQPDGYRAFTDTEYENAGVQASNDLSDCDILMGVKEVAVNTLIPGKKYMFFSHTAKKQPHNRELLKAVLLKNIHLIDYEYLTTEKNTRVVAFGKWAGIVGAYNALRAYGIRFKRYNLKPAWQCRDRKEMLEQLKGVDINQYRILITGGGRVAQGAMETLTQAGIARLSPEDFMRVKPVAAVYSQIDPWHYVKRIDGQPFDLDHFFNFPEEYETTFLPYTLVADMWIACHFWDPRSPVFLTPYDMKRDEFRIRIVADVSCDVNGPIPSTLRASTIQQPFYGYDPQLERETEAFHKDAITIMAVDNLPGELPRDASEDFGSRLISEVLPALLGEADSRIIEKASIAREGKLTERFRYLEDYVEGRE